MSERNFVDELERANVRIERVIWLPGALAAFDALPEDFKEFCEAMPSKADNPLFAELPALKSFASSDYVEPDAVCDALLFPGKAPMGFLFQVASPVTSNHKSDKSYQFSWGYYRTCWRYAETPEVMADIAVAWAAEQLANDRAKAAA